MSSKRKEVGNCNCRVIPCDIVWTIVFAIGLYFFWRMGAACYMSYHEQLQLFLWTGDYFTERIVEPGGLVRYVSEFVVQYYNNFNVGALLLVILFVALQRLSLVILRRNTKGGHHIWSYLPALLFIAIMGDANVMTTALMSFVATTGLIVLLPYDGRWRVIYNCFIATLGYWFVGPMVIGVLIFSLVETLCNGATIRKTTGEIIPFGVIAAMVVTTLYIVPYRLVDLVMGIDYYRLSEGCLMVYSGIVIVVLLPLVALIRWRRVVEMSVAVAMVSCLLVVWPMRYMTEEARRLKCDLLVRTNRWSELVQVSAEDRECNDATQLVAYALAQWHNGQRTSKALISYIAKHKDLNNLTYLSIISEAYLSMGMVNASQRYAFELKELIPNHNNSGRFIIRLAETALVSGRKELAEKYIYVLSHAPFYKKKAERLRELVEDKELLNRHKTYGPFQGSFPENDVIFH